MKLDVKLSSGSFNVVALPIYSRLVKVICFSALRRTISTSIDIVFLKKQHLSCVCGTVNGHNCREWGSENPHDITGHEGDSPRVCV